MSATNRGSVRRKNDYYATPRWLVTSLLNELGCDYPDFAGQTKTILEPACGHSMSIVRVLREHPVFKYAEIRAFDIEPGIEYPSTDFLKAPVPLGDRPDLIITNPPYSLAMEFVQTAMRWSHPTTIICMLLRLNWIASAKRYNWLADNMPHKIYVSSKRPSFTYDGKTDATEYGWFTWSMHARYRESRIRLLEMPREWEVPEKIRKHKHSSSCCIEGNEF